MTLPTPTPDQAVARAVSMWETNTKLRIAYSLGAGGTHPEDDDPCADDGQPNCDCSGFSSWALGLSRRRPGYAGGWGWVSTDSMMADAMSDAPELFGIVRKPALGDLVVYPSTYRKVKGVAKRVRIGHVGLLTHVPTDGHLNWATIRATHCSAGNYRKTGHAVAESNILAWNKFETRFLRPVWWR